MADLLDSPRTTRALPGEGTWAITARLLGIDARDERFMPAFQILGSTNGFPKLTPGQYVDVPPEFEALIPPDLPPPPSNVLGSYADRLNERCQLALDLEQLRRLALGQDPTTVAGQRAVIQTQIDKRRARLDWTCEHLRSRGIDPDTFDLDERSDRSTPRTEVDGRQNLDPGTIVDRAAFNHVVEHRGDHTSEPIIYLDAWHTGITDPAWTGDGTLFKLYGENAPAIFLRGLIDPVVPTFRLIGMRGHHVHAFNLTMRRVVDAFWPLDGRSTPGPKDVILVGLDVQDLAFFAPTPDRPEGTHSDVFQDNGGYGFAVLDSYLRANKDPNVGQGSVVDPVRGWHRDANACYQLSAPGPGLTPVGDMLFAFNDWSRGMSGFNFSANRPLDAPVTLLGDTFAGDTVGDADMIIPSHLNDGRIQLWGVSDPNGDSIRIRYWG